MYCRPENQVRKASEEECQCLCVCVKVYKTSSKVKILQEVQMTSFTLVFEGFLNQKKKKHTTITPMPSVKTTQSRKN